MTRMTHPKVPIRRIKAYTVHKDLQRTVFSRAYDRRTQCARDLKRFAQLKPPINIQLREIRLGSDVLGDELGLEGLR